MYDWIGKITRSEQNMEKFAKFAALVPRQIVLLLFYLSSRILFFLVKGQRRHILLNMQDLLTDRSNRDHQKICKSYFNNLLITVYELVVDSYRLEKNHHSRFIIEGEHYIDEVLKQEKGAILFTSHLGNFFYYYWYLSKKYDCLTVVTASSPELRPLYLIFQRLGCKGLDYDETPPLLMLKKLKKHLQNNGVVLLLGDFFRPNFPKATFFQRVTRSPSGTAVLALEKQVPVIPFYGYRMKGFKHKIKFGPPVYLYEKFTTKQRTEAINDLNLLLENMIREVPDQWFYWFNVNERWEEPSKEETSKIG